MSNKPTISRSDLLSSRVEIPDHVVHRVFPTETVVLNLETGKYHGLNPIGGRMLEELERQGTVEGAARVVAEEYGQPQNDVENDVCDLCMDLARRGLIALDEHANP